MTNLDAIPWYRSQVMISQVVTFVSAVTALVPKLATTLGLTSADVINQSVTTVFGAIAVVATIYGAIQRARSTIQPLTLTQADADIHPQTLANAAATLPTRQP